MFIRYGHTLGAPLAAAAVFAVPLRARLPPAVSELNVPAVLPPAVEGDWNRTNTHGSGSYGGLLSGYAQAALKPGYAEHLTRRFEYSDPRICEIDRSAATAVIPA